MMMNRPWCLWATMLLAAGSLPAQVQEPMSLIRAIQMAQEQNPRVLEARQRVEASEGRIRQAGRIPNPELEISWNEIPSGLAVGNADERDIGISQTIEFPGRRSARLDVATAERDIALLSLSREQVRVISLVKRTYYEAWFQQELVRELDAQSRILDDVAALLMDRFRNGSASYADVIRARLELTRLASERADAEREFRSALSAVNLLIGRPGEIPIVLTDSLGGVARADSVDVMVDSALERSALVRIAIARERQQTSALAVARSSYWPDLTLGLAHQSRNGEPPFDANGFSGTSGSGLGVSVGLSIPLWFWNEPAGQVQEAVALRMIAQAAAATTMRMARSSVENALADVRTARALVRSFDLSLLGDVNEMVAATQSRYRNGQADLLNLLDVHRTARAIRVDYFRALVRQAVALARLEAAAELPELE